MAKKMPEAMDYTPVTYDPQYILMVNHLKKYFPIKGGLLSQTVGHVKAGDGMEPCSTMRSRLTVGSGMGMAENSALV